MISSASSGATTRAPLCGTQVRCKTFPSLAMPTFGGVQIPPEIGVQTRSSGAGPDTAVRDRRRGAGGSGAARQADQGCATTVHGSVWPFRSRCSSSDGWTPPRLRGCGKGLLADPAPLPPSPQLFSDRRRHRKTYPNLVLSSLTGQVVDFVTTTADRPSQDRRRSRPKRRRDDRWRRGVAAPAKHHPKQRAVQPHWGDRGAGRRWLGRRHRWRRKDRCEMGSRCCPHRLVVLMGRRRRFPTQRGGHCGTRHHRWCDVARVAPSAVLMANSSFGSVGDLGVDLTAATAAGFSVHQYFAWRQCRSHHDTPDDEDRTERIHKSFTLRADRHVAWTLITAQELCVVVRDVRPDTGRPGTHQPRTQLRRPPCCWAARTRTPHGGMSRADPGRT